MVRTELNNFAGSAPAAVAFIWSAALVVTFEATLSGASRQRKKPRKGVTGAQANRSNYIGERKGQKNLVSFIHSTSLLLGQRHNVLNSPGSAAFSAGARWNVG
jgi:hypothetical protein